MNPIQHFLNDRLFVACAAANLLLLLLAVVCWNSMCDARDAAVDRAKDAVDCERAAATIESLRGRGTSGSTIVAGSPTEMTRRVQEAADDSAVLQANVRSISPQPPQRLGNSPYSEVSTQIELIGLPLKKTLSFVDALCPAEGGLRLTSFHLNAAESAAETLPDVPAAATKSATKDVNWAVELTVASTTAQTPPARP